MSRLDGIILLYYPHAEPVRDFLREYCGEDAFEFVEVDSVMNRIVDIGCACFDSVGLGITVLLCMIESL